jgi:acyl-coenzyme A thioesterase PaaI-like protein
MNAKGLDRAEELALALAAMDEAAGPKAWLVSFTVDAATGAPAAKAQARVTRSTRTLAFLEADVCDAEGRLTLAASAVYRVGDP